MNNLFNLAKSGLSTAQSALSIVGSNLTNGMSPSYSRRDIIIGESGGLTTSNGFYGYGAVVRGVERAYDAFASSQLRTSVSVWSALDARNEQLSDIDNMLFLFLWATCSNRCPRSVTTHQTVRHDLPYSTVLAR